MLSSKYGEAVVEVLDILEHMDENDVQKVPQSFINMLHENASKDYESSLDYSKRLYEMNLREETRSILGVMYRHYWCPEEKKAEFEKIINENEIEFQKSVEEKYNNDIFSANLGNIVSEEKIINDLNSDNSLVKKEESIFQKFINSILSIFKKIK